MVLNFVVHVHVCLHFLNPVKYCISLNIWLILVLCYVVEIQFTVKCRCMEVFTEKEKCKKHLFLTGSNGCCWVVPMIYENILSMWYSRDKNCNSYLSLALTLEMGKQNLHSNQTHYTLFV